MSSVRRTSGAFSLIELVCVLAIVASLFGMLLPAIQSVRESARRASCLNQLRQIVLAAHSFESAQRRLPPGTLGFGNRYDIDSQQIQTSAWYTPAHQHFWQRAQHTSSLVLLLSNLELAAVSETLPREAMDIGSLWNTSGHAQWIGDQWAMKAAMYQTHSVFVCPSDGADVRRSGAIALLSSQPAVESNTGEDCFIAEPFFTAIEQPGITNYIGCVGAHSGGRYVAADRVGFRGAMTCRERISTETITDGSSNTILYGENIGAIFEGRRQLYYCWMFGGLARGRGNLPWGHDMNPLQPQYLLFGDAHFAYPAGFGSMHPDFVNFALCDGSVRSIGRIVDVAAFYSMCGGYDGGVATTE